MKYIIENNQSVIKYTTPTSLYKFTGTEVGTYFFNGKRKGLLFHNGFSTTYNSMAIMLDKKIDSIIENCSKCMLLEIKVEVSGFLDDETLEEYKIRLYSINSTINFSIKNGDNITFCVLEAIDKVSMYDRVSLYTELGSLKKLSVNIWNII